MATITSKGNPVETCGDLTAVGSKAPDFTLMKSDLNEVSLGDYKGQKLVLNIFPSVDTPTCTTSVRTFNQRAAESGVNVICVSADLPFAAGRY